MKLFFLTMATCADLGRLVSSTRKRFAREISKKSLARHLPAAEDHLFKFIDAFMISGVAETDFLSWGSSSFVENITPQKVARAREMREDIIDKRSRAVQQLLTTWRVHDHIRIVKAAAPFKSIIDAESEQSHFFLQFVERTSVKTWHQFVAHLNNVSGILIESIKQLLAIQESATVEVSKRTRELTTVKSLAITTSRFLGRAREALAQVAGAEEALAKSRFNLAVRHAESCRRRLHGLSWSPEFEVASFKYILISHKWRRFIAEADKNAQLMQDRLVESAEMSRKTKLAWIGLHGAFASQRRFGEMHSRTKASFPLVFDVHDKIEVAETHVEAARRNLEICRNYMRAKLAVVQELDKLVKAIL